MLPQNSQGGGWAGTDMKRWVAEIRVDTRASLNFPEFRAPVIIGRKYFILSTREKVQFLSPLQENGAQTWPNTLQMRDDKGVIFRKEYEGEIVCDGVHE